MIGDILQPTHLLFILVIALLVLGPKRLPEVARSLGSGIRDFRSAISGDSKDDNGRSDSFQLFDEHGQRAPEAEHSYSIAQGTTASEAPGSQSVFEPDAPPADPSAPAPADPAPLGGDAAASEPMSQHASAADTTPAHASAGGERDGSVSPNRA